jgi:hypothetical protein
MNVCRKMTQTSDTDFNVRDTFCEYPVSGPDPALARSSWRTACGSIYGEFLYFLAYFGIFCVTFG